MTEVRREPGGWVSGRVACAPAAIPPPGRYLAARALDEPEAVLAEALFPGDGADPRRESGFWAAGPIPGGWDPGTRLELRGPLGRGFHLPDGPGRLALASFRTSTSRLLPLAFEALEAGADVALFCAEMPVRPLPASVEVQPLEAFGDSLGWADALAVDVPADSLPHLRAQVGGRLRGQTAQALVSGPMPCMGVGACGVCALRIRGSWALACQEGPVFDLEALLEV